VKVARYAAEFALSSDESTQLIIRLKKVQDALGRWHDWLLLTNTAEDLLGELNQSSLVAALRNVTRAKLRQVIIALPKTPELQPPRITGNSASTRNQQSAA
jgi:CHAD domain-containing protein